MIVPRHVVLLILVCLLLARVGWAEPGPAPLRASVARYGSEAAARAAAGRPALAMHPAAKGAAIGAAVGVGAVSAFGLWYCTAGPGECSGENWARVIPVSLAVGAGIGAIIVALR